MACLDASLVFDSIFVLCVVKNVEIHVIVAFSIVG